MSPNKLARSAQKRFWSVPFTFNPFQFAGSSLTAYTISHTSNEIVPKRLLVSHKTHSDIQQTNSEYLDILLTVHLSTVYFSIFPTRYTILFRLHTVSAILLPLHVSGLTGPSSGGLNCSETRWTQDSELRNLFLSVTDFQNNILFLSTLLYHQSITD